MYSMLTARDADASLGKWILPRGKIALISSGLCHMDEAVWNTREGQFPLTSFWSDRFLVYPDDPKSGPLNEDMRAIVNSGPVKSQKANAATDPARPSFSLEGLEGSWIPYGGKSAPLASSLALLPPFFTAEDIRTSGHAAYVLPIGTNVSPPSWTIYLPGEVLCQEPDPLHQRFAHQSI
jgi:hypothetical protein